MSFRDNEKAGAARDAKKNFDTAKADKRRGSSSGCGLFLVGFLGATIIAISEIGWRIFA